MKVIFFCFFLFALGLANVNCLIREDAATWTARVVIQAPSGEWAAEPKEYSPRGDGGVCDEVSGYWAIANVRNDGEHSAGGPVICAPNSDVIPVGEHALPEYIIRLNCPEGYHEGSIFDATVFFDSSAVGVGRTFLAYWYNPRKDYARENVVVAPNFESAKHGFELELFEPEDFVNNPDTDESVADKLCVRNDARFTFAWSSATNTARSDKNTICQAELNSNYRAATASELSNHIKSFFSYADIKPYVRAFDVDTDPGQPPRAGEEYDGVANGILVADDACRSYIPTYGRWETTPECNEVDVVTCACYDADTGDAADCDNSCGVRDLNDFDIVIPEFVETSFPLLSVHDNRYSRILWRQDVECRDTIADGDVYCVRTGTQNVNFIYGCKATEIGAQSQDQQGLGNVVPIACIADSYIDRAGYQYDETPCPDPIDFVEPTWDHGRDWEFRTAAP